MKLLFAGLAVALSSLTLHPAEAKVKKHAVMRESDRAMTAHPAPAPVEAPVFRWSGRSSWGTPGVNDTNPTDSANGS